MNHPFEPFIPKNAKYLLLGSFPGQEQTTGTIKDDSWYYGNSRNQFWLFLEEVYATSLKSKFDKQRLFEALNMAITDVFSSIIRKRDSSLDKDIDLEKSTYNDIVIAKILSENHIEKVFCTSRFVEQIFNKRFPAYKAIYLPSPSRRNATMSRDEKVQEYIRLLPLHEKL